MILPKNNIRQKVCHQWIAKIEKKADGNSFYFCIYDYKGNALYTSGEYDDVESCKREIWELRNKGIDDENRKELDKQKLTNEIFSRTDMVGRITRANFVRSSFVTFNRPKRVKSNSKKGKRIGEIPTIKVQRKAFSLDDKKIMQENRVKSTVSRRDLHASLPPMDIFRESGQVVDCSEKKKESPSISSPVTPQIIDYMYSLDGRGKILHNGVEYQDTSNPTKFKQWRDENNLFWNNEKLREFFCDVIIGGDDEK